MVVFFLSHILKMRKAFIPFYGNQLCRALFQYEMIIDVTGNVAVLKQVPMLLYNKDEGFLPSEIDRLFPQVQEQHLLKGVSETLYSNLVISFEQSIEDGMRPIESLTTILRWVSGEMARISVEDGQRNSAVSTEGLRGIT